MWSRLVKVGLMKSDSPLGTWEISDIGREHLINLSSEEDLNSE